MTLSWDERSHALVQRRLTRMLEETRRQGPALVKRLARGAANSAAKLTIPNKGRNTPRSGAKSSVRRPVAADKFRPVVSAKEVPGGGNFYILNKKSNDKGTKKKKRRGNRSGFSGKKSKRVMAGSRGELIIYTDKKISQKDSRFKKVTKVIKAWDKKGKHWRYYPTLTTKKYEKDTRVGKIPDFFTAKQGWLWSARKINRTMVKLNKSSTRQGYMTDKLRRKDNPGLALHNTSNYVLKSGGSAVPRKALYLAMRGFIKQLEKQTKDIVKKSEV